MAPWLVDELSDGELGAPEHVSGYRALFPTREDAEPVPGELIEPLLIDRLQLIARASRQPDTHHLRIRGQEAGKLPQLIVNPIDCSGAGEHIGFTLNPVILANLHGEESERRDDRDRPDDLAKGSSCLPTHSPVLPSDSGIGPCPPPSLAA